MTPPKAPPPRRFVAGFATMATLTACQVGPTYHRPALDLTPAFRAAAGSETSKTTSLDAWWTAFGDPELSSLVQRAAAQNLDLAQAGARLAQSHALARAAGAALAPTLDADSAFANGRESLLSPLGVIGRHLPGYPRDYNDATLGLTAAWEIDLFGGLRREREAARADAMAADAQMQAVKVAVQADAADAYLQIRGLQARLDVAGAQVGVERDLVALLTRRITQGVSPERELHDAEAALDAVLATQPPLIQALEIQLNRLDLLMGLQPGTCRVELIATAAVPDPPAMPLASTPADLLRRRPDVVAAEQRLIAANAEVGAAISDYYPKISLSVLFGADSLAPGQLLSGEAFSRQAAAGLRWRLFDFGRVDAEVAAAKGKDAEALAAYRQSVLQAAQEVENALSDLAQQQARAAALARQIAHLALARRQAQDAFDGGVISLVEVRDADRDLLAARDQLAVSRTGAARAAVASFRAMGGGWAPMAGERSAS